VDLTHSQDTQGTQATRAIKVGVTLFIVGVVFIAIDVLPFLFGTNDRPLWLNLACMAAPAGFVLAIVGAWRQGRTVARAAATDLADPSTR
jgi:uncharacterized membrane protein YhdT